MKYGLLVALVALTFGAPASARTGKGVPAVSAAWVGTFSTSAAREACKDCAAPKVVARGGSVRVLKPANGGAAAEGDVVVVSPLLGAITSGKIADGVVALPWFVDDARDSDAGVLVLPGNVTPRLVTPSKADDAGIRAALMRDETLAGIKKSLAKLEVGAVDVDGDGKADFAVTYGCAAWNDGACQLRGQFFLVRHGVRWDEIE
jgi:hypothetical protein